MWHSTPASQPAWSTPPVTGAGSRSSTTPSAAPSTKPCALAATPTAAPCARSRTACSLSLAPCSVPARCSTPGTRRSPARRLLSRQPAGDAEAGPAGEQPAQEYPAGNSSKDDPAGAGLPAWHPLLPLPFDRFPHASENSGVRGLAPARFALLAAHPPWSRLPGSLASVECQIGWREFLSFAGVDSTDCGTKDPARVGGNR